LPERPLRGRARGRAHGSDVALIDDGYAGSALPARRKAAIALTDVVLGRRDLDDELAATLRREWTAPSWSS
jgi:hypothetical protein